MKKDLECGDATEKLLERALARSRIRSEKDGKECPLSVSLMDEVVRMVKRRFGGTCLHEEIAKELFEWLVSVVAGCIEELNEENSVAQIDASDPGRHMGIFGPLVEE